VSSHRAARNSANQAVVRAEQDGLVARLVVEPHVLGEITGEVLVEVVEIHRLAPVSLGPPGVEVLVVLVE
jgi:hypothetical protein